MFIGWTLTEYLWKWWNSNCMFFMESQSPSRRRGGGSSCANISTSFLCHFRWRSWDFLPSLLVVRLLQLCKYIYSFPNFKTTSTPTKTSQTCPPLLPSLPSTRPPRFAHFLRKLRSGTITDRLVILQKELESFLEQEYVFFSIRYMRNPWSILTLHNRQAKAKLQASIHELTNTCKSIVQANRSSLYWLFIFRLEHVCWPSISSG